MAENKHLPSPASLPDPAVGHEESDVNAWAVGKFAIGLVFLCIVALSLLVGLFKYFQSLEGGLPSPSAAAVKLPAAPTLEVTPLLDLKAMRAEEDQALKSYRWVDQPRGVVQIPIDRAIDLLAQRGLPSRPQADPQTAAGDVSMPTESGLGPKMQQPGGSLAGELK